MVETGQNPSSACFKKESLFFLCNFRVVVLICQSDKRRKLHQLQQRIKIIPCHAHILHIRQYYLWSSKHHWELQHECHVHWWFDIRSNFAYIQYWICEIGVISLQLRSSRFSSTVRSHSFACNWWINNKSTFTVSGAIHEMGCCFLYPQKCFKIRKSVFIAFTSAGGHLPQCRKFLSVSKSRADMSQ